MKKILGYLLIAFGVFLEFMWLSFCFGSVIIGVLLLIFAPRILFFPFNFFLVLGIVTINGKNYKYYSNYKQQNYNQNNYTNTYTSVNTMDKYYAVLESSSNDSLDTIKKNYRRLMKEYHYDSIASKGLPEKMLKFAEEKTKELNEAYEAVKKAKK